MRYVVVLVGMTALFAEAAGAQDPAAAAAKQAAERQAIVARPGVRLTVEGRLVKGAPYSGEAVTESVQSLADGNRIVTRHVTRIVRDSAGRTRREQLNAAGTDVTTISISDPVAGTSYVLDPVSRLANRTGGVLTTPTGTEIMTVLPSASGGSITTYTRQEGSVGPAAVQITRQDAEVRAGAGAEAGRSELRVNTTTTGAPAVTGFSTSTFARATPVGQTTREELGQQMVEGVMASGTRSTTEIAAGAIGNEQPIRTIAEQWFSPELQVLVMTRHADPRSGETIYRLTNVVRSEPARTLFEVPADYTLRESTIRREQK